MSEKTDYSEEKPRGLNKKWAIFGVVVLFLILVGLGSSAVLRPVIVLKSNERGVFVKNTGGLDALIHRVDGFWFWSGRVAYIANMPSIHQRVESGSDFVRLDIPNIPVPEEHTPQQGPFYMRLWVRYIIPGMPIFRYAEQLFFKYDPDLNRWTAAKDIPLKYRSLGTLTIGDVDKVKLKFH